MISYLMRPYPIWCIETEPQKRTGAQQPVPASHETTLLPNIYFMLHELTHMRDCAFFQTRHLRLTDTNLVRNFHLRPALKKPQVQNMLFPAAETFHRLIEANLLEPLVVTAFFILDLIHDKIASPPPSW